MDTMSAAKAGTAETDVRQASGELPRVLIFTAAVTCGLFLALVVHIVLDGAGAGLTRVWRDLFPTSTAQLESALAWWAIGASACIGAWATILLLRPSSRWPAHRLLRLSFGFAFFCLFAAAGHAAPAGSMGTSMAVAGNLAAMSLGAFMAFCTAHFALPR
jgi:hypothetical protein